MCSLSLYHDILDVSVKYFHIVKSIVIFWKKYKIGKEATSPLGVCIPQGTVLIKNAEELMNFSRGEENLMEAQVKAIADAGANVVVTGGKVADMALHYANKHQLMVVR